MDYDYVLRGIEYGFRFMERRAETVERLICTHRETFGHGASEPSIDAICLSMVCLAALGKLRFEREVGRGQYALQFRELLRHYCGSIFVDRLSIPELVLHGPYKTIDQAVITLLERRFPLAARAMNHTLDRDPLMPEVISALHDGGRTAEERDLARFEYSAIIYRKYRNPVIHALNIGDGEEPRNIWRVQPGLFYENKLRRDSFGDLVSIRLLGVTDEYLFDLLREANRNLKEWCLHERTNIFVP